MIELAPLEFNLAGPLFSAAPYGVLSAGTLEGGHAGRVFVDQRDHPRAALICTRVGYHFLSGQPSEGLVAQLGRLFSAELIPTQKNETQNPEFLLFYNPPAWAEALLREFESYHPILIYKKRHTLPTGAEESLRGWQARLPTGLSAAPLTADLLRAHTELRETAELFYGSIDAFLRHGFGVCVLEGDVLACVCRSVFTGAGEVEIDIQTEPAYRGRGLAFLAASAFIEECLARGLRPVWGCWPENTPSLNLAHRLGFTAEPDQPVCLWVDE